MSSGTRLVFAFLLFAGLVFVVLEVYGGRSLSRRGQDSPALAAREAVQADNTVVGVVGGIETFEALSVEFPEGTAAERARVEARIVGGRDSGRMVADLGRDERGRWTVRSASFTRSDGTTIPVAGSAGR